VPENPRIEDLKRRVQSDPASIAFAQLAEEYRRAGDFKEAVRVCRAGLAQHPTYLSARVTLGRALMELDQYDEAQSEFEYVLLAAPDNLIALRSMAEIHQQRGELGEAFKQYSAAVDVANAPTGVTPPPDPAVTELEAWLAAILNDRAARAAS
jgi:tetratricopeptide (TPR) repeat protein